MPDNPHQEIEQRLRAAADSRRRAAGGPFSLHPADRRMLQEEVARTHGQAARDARPAWLLWLLRHRTELVCYSALVLVLMVILPGMFAPAMQKARSKASAPAPTALPPPAALPAGEPKPTGKSEALRAEAAAPPAPAPAAPEAALASAQKEARTDSAAFATRESESLAVQVARSRPRMAPAAPAKSSPPAPTAVLADAAPLAAAVASDAEPLSRFRLEHSGSIVTVVDADGSVYRGSVIATAAQELAEPAPARGLGGAAPPPVARSQDVTATARDNRRRYGVAAPARESATTRAQALSFHVSGTNRTLQQLVQLQATMPVAQDRLSATQLWVRSGTSNLLPGLYQWRQIETTAAAGGAATNAALFGELQIGPKAPVRIEARPASR